MWTSILTWVATFVLNYLMKYLTKKIEQHEDNIERGKVNETNTKKYEDAKDRAERVRAGLDLINRKRT